MAFVKMIRSITFGMIFALLAIGLLPLLLAAFVLDLNGLADIDATPLIAFMKKTIGDSQSSFFDR